MMKNDLQKALVNACYYGDYAGVCSLIESGAKPNIADGRGYLPVHFACQEGHVKILKLLVSHGADLESADSEDNRPLFTAAGEWHIGLVRYLITMGCDVNARRAPPHDDTPLILASAFGRLAVVVALAKAGADIEAKDRRKRTPIFFAVMGGHTSTAQFLIEQGAKLTRKCRNSEIARICLILREIRTMQK